jgi:hypothetical protein
MDKELLAAVQSIARSVQPRFSISDGLQIVLALATIATAGLLCWYALETKRLRQAAEQQVTESQLQTEYSMKPVVVLTTAIDEGHVTRPNKFSLKNVGKGAALNTRVHPFSHNKTVQWWFQHRSVIAADELHFTVFGEVGKPASSVPENMKWVLNQQDALKEVPLVITYNGISGQRYQTQHTLMLTEDRSDLIVRVDKAGSKAI